MCHQKIRIFPFLTGNRTSANFSRGCTSHIQFGSITYEPPRRFADLPLIVGSYLGLRNDNRPLLLQPSNARASCILQEPYDLGEQMPSLLRNHVGWYGAFFRTYEISGGDRPSCAHNLLGSRLGEELLQEPPRRCSSMQLQRCWCRILLLCILFAYQLAGHSTLTTYKGKPSLGCATNRTGRLLCNWGIRLLF